MLSAARFGIAVEDTNIYTTMQPCFGCTKELIQAKIKNIIYLHPWSPSDEDSNMQERKKSEYDKIIAKINIKKMSIDDPRKEWAVTSLSPNN